MIIPETLTDAQIREFSRTVVGRDLQAYAWSVMATEGSDSERSIARKHVCEYLNARAKASP